MANNAIIEEHKSQEAGTNKNIVAKYQKHIMHHTSLKTIQSELEVAQQGEHV